MKHSGGKAVIHRVHNHCIIHRDYVSEDGNSIITVRSPLQYSVNWMILHTTCLCHGRNGDIHIKEPSGL